MEQGYIQRCPYLYQETPDTNLYDFVTTHFKRNQNKIALVDNATKEQYTFGKLQQLATDVSFNLQTMGMRKGQSIALYSCNSIEYVVLILASWRLGIIMCGISPSSPTTFVQTVLELAKPDMLFTYAEYETGLKKQGLNESMRVILIDSQSDRICYEDLLKPRPVGCDIDTVNLDNQNDVALISFSSGTTGPPKAIQVTHRNLVNTVFVTLAPEISMHWKINVNYLPLQQLFGLLPLCSGLYMGNTTVMMSAFDLDAYLEALSAYKVERILIPPSVGLLLATHPTVVKHDLAAHLKSTFFGGSRLSSKIQDALRKRFGKHLQILQAYGTTETGGLTSCPLTNYDGEPPETVGVPIPGCEIKVIDLKTGVTQPANQMGEVCSRSDSVMKGYLDNPTATAEVIDAEHWYHTGDFGYYDDKGFFFLVDRVKDLIFYHDYQIAPRELESVLLSHADVADAAVIGVPDKTSGQVPLAFVITKQDITVAEDDITSYVTDRVPDHQRLRGGVKFVSTIPRSPAGKILKRLLREQLEI